MIDVAALQSLISVSAHGTVGGAARALGYTPSAVSQQIKRLERSLGVALLERVGRRVVLTPDAQVLVEQGASVLASLDSLDSRVRSGGQGGSGQVRLAAFSTAVRGLVAPVARSLAASDPELELTLVERDPAESLNLVASGAVDMAIVHNWDGVALHAPAALELEQIGSDVADVLLHRDHPLASRPHVTPADLIDDAWVCTEVGTICHAWFLHMYAGQPRLPRVAYSAWEFASHVRLVEEGMAVALVPRLGRGPLPEDVRAVPVRHPVPTRTIYVVRRTSNRHNPLVERVVARLRASGTPRSVA